MHLSNLLTKLFAFTYRNWIFSKRNIFAFAEILFWPVVGLISIGLMGNFLNLDEKMRSFILIGAITGGALQVTQLDVSYGVLYDIWSKSLKHTFLAPVSNYNFIVGSWIVGIVRGIIVFGLMSLFSYFAFGFYLPSLHVSIIFICGIFLSALIIGMTVCLLVLLYGQRVEITAWSLATLSMLVCGIYYPVNYLPGFFITLSSFIPMTHFLEYFRSSYGFTPFFKNSLLKGFIESILYIFLLFKLLNYATARARKTAMILKLSE